MSIDVQYKTQSGSFLSYRTSIHSRETRDSLKMGIFFTSAAEKEWG